MTDIEIAKNVKLENIENIAKKAGIEPEDIECYGKYKAKISDKIFEKVKNIIVDLLQVSEDSVTLDAHFIDDLGADSLDLVELIMGVEEEFNIEIPEGEADKVVTVGDVVEYIKENVE